MDVKYTKDGKRVKVTKTELRQFEAPLRTLAGMAENGDREALEARKLLLSLLPKYAAPVVMKGGSDDAA